MNVIIDRTITAEFYKVLRDVQERFQTLNLLRIETFDGFETKEIKEPIKHRDRMIKQSRVKCLSKSRHGLITYNVLGGVVQAIKANCVRSIEPRKAITFGEK